MDDRDEARFILNKNMSQDKKIAGLSKPVLIWSGITLGVVVLFAAGLIGGGYAYTKMFKDRIYPGVSALGVRLDGMHKDEAAKALNQAADNALDKGLVFALDGKSVTLQASSNNDAPDLILYDVNKAVDSAYQVGRQDDMRKIVYELLMARIRNKQIAVDVQIDENRIGEALQEQFADQLPAPKDATYEIVIESDGSPAVHVVPDKDGVELELQSAYQKLRKQAEVLTFSPISLKTKKIQATKLAADLQPLLDKVKEVLGRPQLVFTYEEKLIRIPTSTLALWVTANQAGEVTLDKTAFASSIRALAKDIEIESKSGSIETKDGKIIKFEAGTVGRSVNVDKTLEPVLTSWPPTSTFPLVVEETRGQISGDELQEFGIKELVGVGKSNFANSPANRTRNIRKAVDEKVNGTLIAPGETFSMLKTLGPVDGVHGWLPELVIKGDKTTPEFGGGLCQIGTTMFRAAIASGLPVTERRNHSYRVSYYEPAGTDATIYEPAPDFKFLNDTGKYIFVNAYIKGTEITFEMWGTKDGRTVETTKPKIYNIVAAPATKLVESTDLAPGKKKCTESAHAGADAEFSTAVTYADGNKREETFRSHYRPWGAVCLIGVEKKTDTSATTDTTADPAAAGN